MFEDLITQLSTIGAKRSFNTPEKVFFFKEMSYLLKGGVSIVDTIETLNISSDNLKIQEITHYIFEMLDGGKSFTYALSRLGEHFSSGDVAIIRAGESSGRLPEVLASLAHEYGFLYKTQKEYKGAMLYPAILLTISIVAVFALFVFILPGLFGLVESFDPGAIPFMTRFMMKLSTFLNENIVYIIIGAIVFSMSMRAFYATKKGKRFFYTVLMELPAFGKITKNYQLIKFSRYMKLMISSGLNYIDILRMQKEIMDMPLYKDMADHVLIGLRNGKGIFDGMETYTDIIPRDVLVLLKVGEETATLTESLDNIVTMYSEDLEIQIRSMSKVIEPVMITIVGGVIGLVAISVFGIIGSVMDSLPNM